MKKQYLIACLAVLVITGLGIVIGVGAGSNGKDSQTLYPPSSPISAAAFGTTSTTFWDAGSNGFLRTEPASPGTLGKQISAADITIPPGATAKFVTPLGVPSSVSGNPTAVNNILLQWNASSSCTITNVEVFSGFFFFGGAGGFARSDVGTGTLQNLNVNLGAFYPVANGLAMQWSIHNSASSPQIASIYAYGAKIRY